MKSKIYYITTASLILLVYTTQLSGQLTNDKTPILKDQVISDDLIVKGEACVGLGCSNGYSLGNNDFVIRSGNIEILFDDVDSQPPFDFPDENWMISINDAVLPTSGGRNAFMILDEDNELFTIESGSEDYALYINENGDVGFGTDEPTADLHILDDNTPLLRLEQDGSAGFSPQTWDIGANESEFFIRDTTHNTVPFRIIPGASNNSLYVNSEGKVGLGTSNPQHELHIEGDLGMTGGIYGVSDQRLKEELGPISDAVHTIRQLEPRWYRFLQSENEQGHHLPGGAHYGFYAQELQKVLPDLVTGFGSADSLEGGGNLLSINYIEIIPLMVKAFQELTDQVTDQQGLIEAQNNRIKLLERQSILNSTYNN